MFSQEATVAYPSLPASDDSRWLEATVRAGRLASADLVSDPVDYGTVILTVFAGDVIQVMREMRYDHWVVAKVGYKIGWLNFRDINFTVMRRRHAPKPATQMQVAQQVNRVENDWFSNEAEDVPEELLVLQTQEVQRQTQSTGQVNSNDIGRIISRLKNLLKRGA